MSDLGRNIFKVKKLLSELFDMHFKIRPYEMKFNFLDHLAECVTRFIALGLLNSTSF